jgi:hypothetical protein
MSFEQTDVVTAIIWTAHYLQLFNRTTKKMLLQLPLLISIKHNEGLLLDKHEKANPFNYEDII